MYDLMMNRFDAVRPTAARQDARHLLGLLRLMLRTYQTREALLDLTPRQQADIGISSFTALSEAARLPWDVRPTPGRHAAGILGAIQHTLQRIRTRGIVSRLDVR